MSEWSIVCPDGKVRRPPYEVKQEAVDDAAWMSDEGMCLDPFLGEETDCPGGPHTIKEVQE